MDHARCESPEVILGRSRRTGEGDARTGDTVRGNRLIWVVAGVVFLGAIAAAVLPLVL